MKKPVKFPDELPAYKEHLRISLVEEEEVTNEGIFTRLKIDSKQYNDTLSKLTMPSSLDLFTVRQLDECIINFKISTRFKWQNLTHSCCLSNVTFAVLLFQEKIDLNYP